MRKNEYRPSAQGNGVAVPLGQYAPAGHTSPVTPSVGVLELAAKAQ